MLAKGRSKRVVVKAQGEERQGYCVMLEAEDGKVNVFRVAKQMVGLNRHYCEWMCEGGEWENCSRGSRDNAKKERIL